MSNSDRITQRFLEEKILTGYVMYKKGNGHNDFPPLILYIFLRPTGFAGRNRLSF